MKDLALELFREKYAAYKEPVVVRAPGRINLIGEHTDYNEGFVLPAAIRKWVYIAMSPRNDEEIHLFSKDMETGFKTRLSELRPLKEPAWPNYVLGAVAQFQTLRPLETGFNAVLVSDLPMGAGLSSSAAVECATLFALNEMVQAGLDRMTMVRMAQAAEHAYAGVKCGIMDMFASIHGKAGHALKLDCRSLEFEYVPCDFDEFEIVLLNSHVKHSLAASEYNVRRQACSQAVEWVREFEPTVNSLRDVSTGMLENYVFPKSAAIGAQAAYVVEEIQRLHQACAALQRKDLSSLGEKMYATHEGLSRLYRVSCKELDWLVDFTKNRPEVLGARMMGGGFGGCSINLVKKGEVDAFVFEITRDYEKTMQLPLTHYRVSIGDGAERI